MTHAAARFLDLWLDAHDVPSVARFWAAALDMRMASPIEGAVRLAGQPILSPGPMALIATCALVTWACWSLAFFMPDVYRRHVLGEHPTDATEQG